MASIKHQIVLLILLFSTYVNSEDVYVKFEGMTNIDNFSCMATSSSFVHRVCYDETNRYAIVLLESTYYHYCEVPIAVINNWLNASSQGRFYLSNIKGDYDCRTYGTPKANSK